MATILIVDDERAVRDVLTLVLADSGHCTLLAVHRRHALKLMAADPAHPPDLVITDVMMPVLGGTELCRRLKAAAATRHIPVILMSAGGARLAAGVGAQAFLQKPFQLEELETLVEHWRLRRIKAGRSHDAQGLGDSRRHRRRGWSSLSRRGMRRALPLPRSVCLGHLAATVPASSAP